MTKKTRYFMAGSAAVLVLGLCTGLVAYYGGGFQALSASSGPNELNYVPAGATLVAYADVRAIMDSDLRQRLKQALGGHEEQGQKEFQEQTGIDIERDIDYVVAAMTSLNPAGGPPAGLVIANGRFDVVKLETLAREHGGTVADYQGKRLVMSPSEIDVNGEKKPLPHQITMAFLEPGVVAVGESAAEGAIFALLGLLVAFTFSGAASRFDARRQLIVEETNDIGTAYLRLRLLPLSAQPALREQFRQYVDARLAFYRKLKDMPAAMAEHVKAIEKFVALDSCSVDFHLFAVALSGVGCGRKRAAGRAEAAAEILQVGTARTALKANRCNAPGPVGRFAHRTRSQNMLTCDDSTPPSPGTRTIASTFGVRSTRPSTTTASSPGCCSRRA